MNHRQYLVPKPSQPRMSDNEITEWYKKLIPRALREGWYEYSPLIAEPLYELLLEEDDLTRYERSNIPVSFYLPLDKWYTHIGNDPLEEVDYNWLEIFGDFSEEFSSLFQRIVADIMLKEPQGVLMYRHFLWEVAGFEEGIGPPQDDNPKLFNYIPPIAERANLMEAAFYEYGISDQPLFGATALLLRIVQDMNIEDLYRRSEESPFVEP